MELLRKKIAAFLIGIAIISNAQSVSTLDAFAESYTKEYEGKYQEAIVQLTNVYKAESYEINLRLGWLHYLNASYGESVNFYTKAIKLMPAATEPHWGIVNPLSKLEKWLEVEKSYLSILQLDPANSTAHYKLGVMYYYRKDYVKAKRYFDVSLNQFPFDYDANLMSAWNNYFLGYSSQAKILFNKVLLIRPGDTSAKEGLGLIK